MLLTSILIAYVIPTLFVLYCALHMRSKELAITAFFPVWNLRLTIEWIWVFVETCHKAKKGE